jgi:hypothetical protein
MGTPLPGHSVVVAVSKVKQRERLFLWDIGVCPVSGLDGDGHRGILRLTELRLLRVVAPSWAINGDEQRGDGRLGAERGRRVEDGASFKRL